MLMKDNYDYGPHIDKISSCWFVKLITAILIQM